MSSVVIIVVKKYSTANENQQFFILWGPFAPVIFIYTINVHLNPKIARQATLKSMWIKKKHTNRHDLFISIKQNNKNVHILLEILYRTWDVTTLLFKSRMDNQVRELPSINHNSGDIQFIHAWHDLRVETVIYYWNGIQS